MDQESGPFFVMTTVLSPEPPDGAGDDAGVVWEGFGVAVAEVDGFGVAEAEGEGVGVAEAEGLGVGVADEEGVPEPDCFPFRVSTTDFPSDDLTRVYAGLEVVSTTTLVRWGSDRFAIRTWTTEPVLISNLTVCGTEAFNISNTRR